MASDEELFLSYLREGDVESLSALVDRNNVRLSAFLSGILPKMEVEDAFQDTWRCLMSRAAAYHGGSFVAYLIMTARRVAIDRLRRRKELVSLDAEPSAGEVALSEQVADTAPTPSERLQSKATAEDVRRAVRALPAGPRQVVMMRIEGELSFKEIAAELGVPIGTALSWMHVATERLREQLGGVR